MTQLMRCSFALLLLCVAFPAYAAVQVTDQLLQQGIYLKEGCTSPGSQEEYNSCVCEADIHYPQLGGLTDKTAETTLNDSFHNAAQAMLCEGKQLDAKVDKTKYGDDHASSLHHYEITFQSDRLLGLSFSDSVYSGGMQDDTKINGVIIDIVQGKILTIADLFVLENLQAVNTAIYDMLIARPEGEVWHDQVESRKGAFVTEKECTGCTLIVQKDGVHVVFKPYEISPSIASQIDLLLPAKLLRNPEWFAAPSADAAAH